MKYLLKIQQIRLYEVNLYKGTYYKETEKLDIGPLQRNEVPIRVFPLQDNNNINSYFNSQIKQIRKKENFIFSLLEKKNYDSISNKIVCAIKSEHPKFIYRAPFFQGIGTKIYNVFKQSIV